MLSLVRAACPTLRPQLFQRPFIQSAARWYSEKALSQRTSNTVSPLPQLGWTAPIAAAALQQVNAGLQTPEEIWAKKSEDAHKHLSIYPPANAYSGRSVEVFKDDLGGAFRKLSGILSRNKVRQQLKMTERHEKKGAKRRRLSSERWRRRFAEEVRNKVQLVEQIRRRGA